MNIFNEDLNKIAIAIHENAQAKGFWDKDYNHDEKVMLIISELGEALEAHRSGKFADIGKYHECHKDLVYLSPEQRREKAFKEFMKDTFEDELADTAIRIMDLAKKENLNVSLINEFGEMALVPSNFPSDNVGQDLLLITACLAPYQIGEAKVCSLLSLLSHLADKHGIDLLYHIKEKMWYNSTRQRMHGKSY